jgi:thiamine biosynthesis lipoprotein
MAMASTRVLLSACCVLAVGCDRPGAGTEFVEDRFFAMGTWVDLSFVSPGPEARDAALREIEVALREFERDFYPWTDGELATLNSAIADGREMTVSPEMAQLLIRARDLSRISDGLFEPGLGKLVELWGFHTTTLTDPQPPTAEAIAATLDASGGIDVLEIDGQQIRSAGRSLTLDLGGIAKGAAVDEILALLEPHGIDSALINAGGDLAVSGQALGDRPWRVGIRDPRTDGLLGIVELADGEAAFTSGDYERFYEYQGQRLHHLLDPKTGRPVEHTQALTVVGTDPTTADAAATALFVAGPDRWRVTADRLGIDAVLRVDASGEVELTQQMAARLEPTNTAHDIIMGSGQESPP